MTTGKRNELAGARLSLFPTIFEWKCPRYDKTSNPICLYCSTLSCDQTQKVIYYNNNSQNFPVRPKLNTSQNMLLDGTASLYRQLAYRRNLSRCTPDYSISPGSVTSQYLRFLIGWEDPRDGGLSANQLSAFPWGRLVEYSIWAPCYLRTYLVLKEAKW